MTARRQTKLTEDIITSAQEDRPKRQEERKEGHEDGRRRYQNKLNSTPTEQNLT